MVIFKVNKVIHFNISKCKFLTKKYFYGMMSIYLILVFSYRHALPVHPMSHLSSSNLLGWSTVDTDCVTSWVNRAKA